MKTLAALLLATMFVCPATFAATWDNPALTVNLAGDDGLDLDCFWVCANGDCSLECIE